MRKRTPITAAATLLAAAGIAAPAASAAPAVTEASGQDAAAIQPAVDSFRNQLGTPNGGGPPAANGRRQIVWDGAPDGRAAPSFMPENNFRNVGALFSTPGLGFSLSMDDNDPADPDPDAVEFGDLNLTYPGALEPFSQERLFAPIDSNVTETRFVVPGTNTPAQTNAFGVVFSDVDQAGATKIELLDAEGASLGTWPVPAIAGGNETFSFVGIVLDPGVTAARAVITTGTAPLGPDDVTQGGSADVVAMDDFVYGEPQAIPAKAPDTGGPELAVRGVDRKADLADLAKGLKVKADTDEVASVDARLTAAAKRVEFAKAGGSILLAEKSSGPQAGRHRLTLKPKRSVLRGADRLRLELRVIATDEAGNRTTIKRKITAS